MIKLSEVISHTLAQDEKAKKSNLIKLDNYKEWRWSDLDHLLSMGFNQDGEYHMALMSPKLFVYKVKNEGYHLVDKDKNEHKVFPKFSQLIDHFDKYEQEFEF